MRQYTYNNFPSGVYTVARSSSHRFCHFFEIRQPLCKMLSVQVTQPLDEGKPNLEVARGLLSSKQ
jgi:hypothetical protein